MGSHWEPGLNADYYFTWWYDYQGRCYVAWNCCPVPGFSGSPPAVGGVSKNAKEGHQCSTLALDAVSLFSGIWVPHVLDALVALIFGSRYKTWESSKPLLLEDVPRMETSQRTPDPPQRVWTPSSLCTARFPNTAQGSVWVVQCCAALVAALDSGQGGGMILLYQRIPALRAMPLTSLRPQEKHMFTKRIVNPKQLMWIIV